MSGTKNCKVYGSGEWCRLSGVLERVEFDISLVNNYIYMYTMNRIISHNDKINFYGNKKKCDFLQSKIEIYYKYEPMALFFQRLLILFYHLPPSKAIKALGCMRGC